MSGLIIFGSLFLIILIEELLRRKPKTKGISGGLNWRVKKGTLILSGKGPMENFAENNRAPWGVKIRSVIPGEGVTTIGESAFSGCTKLTTVFIPENIRSIGNHAFAYCTALEQVTIANSKDKVKLGTGVFPEGTSVIYEK